MLRRGEGHCAASGRLQQRLHGASRTDSSSSTMEISGSWLITTLTVRPRGSRLLDRHRASRSHTLVRGRRPGGVGQRASEARRGGRWRQSAGAIGPRRSAILTSSASERAFIFCMTCARCPLTVTSTGPQLGGDLLVEKAGHHQRQHIFLPPGEGVVPRASAPPPPSGDAARLDRARWPSEWRPGAPDHRKGFVKNSIAPAFIA